MRKTENDAIFKAILTENFPKPQIQEAQRQANKNKKPQKNHPLYLGIPYSNFIISKIKKKILKEVTQARQ